MESLPWDVSIPEILTAASLFAGGVVYIALDTLRLLIVGRGYRLAASVVGFSEVFVFLLAVSKILGGELNILNLTAYAAGFGGGTWVGAVIEDRLAIGTVMARIVTNHDATGLMAALAEQGFGITNVAASGQSGRARIVFSVMRRRNLKKFTKIVNEYHPNAFMSVEDVRFVHDAQRRRIAGLPE